MKKFFKENLSNFNLFPLEINNCSAKRDEKKISRIFPQNVMGKSSIKPQFEKKEEMKRSEERIYLEIDKIDEMPSFS